MTKQEKTKTQSLKGYLYIKKKFFYLSQKTVKKFINLKQALSE